MRECCQINKTVEFGIQSTRVKILKSETFIRLEVKYYKSFSLIYVQKAKELITYLIVYK